MFEKNIQIAKESLLKEINFQGKYIFLKEILDNPSIDDAYKAYFKAEANWWIYEKQVERRNTLNFDYSNPGLKAILEQLDELYFETARFDSATLFNLVDTAVKVRANMVCRPRNTLRWFVYRLEKTKPFIEVVKRLDYLSDYAYLTGDLVNDLKESGIVQSDYDIVNAEYFSSLVEKIDDNYIYNISPEQFTGLIEPVFSFFNPGAGPGESRVAPVEALIICLDDKNIPALASKLEAMKKENNITTISKKYFIDFIFNQLELLDLDAGDFAFEETEQAASVETSIDFAEPSSDQFEIASETKIVFPAMEDLAEEPEPTAIPVEFPEEFISQAFDNEPEMPEEVPDLEDLAPSGDTADDISIGLPGEEGLSELLAELEGLPAVSAEEETPDEAEEEDFPDIAMASFDEDALKSEMEEAELPEEFLPGMETPGDETPLDLTEFEMAEDIIPDDIGLAAQEEAEQAVYEEAGSAGLPSGFDGMLLSNLITDEDEIENEQPFNLTGDSTGQAFAEIEAGTEGEAGELSLEDDILNLDPGEIFVDNNNGKEPGTKEIFSEKEPQSTDEFNGLAEEDIFPEIASPAIDEEDIIIPDNFNEMIADENRIMEEIHALNLSANGAEAIKAEELPEKEEQLTDDILQEIDFDSITDMKIALDGSINDEEGAGETTAETWTEESAETALDDNEDMTMRGKLINTIEYFGSKSGTFKGSFLEGLESLLREEETTSEDVEMDSAGTEETPRLTEAFPEAEELTVPDAKPAVEPVTELTVPASGTDETDFSDDLFPAVSTDDAFFTDGSLPLDLLGGIDEDKDIK